MLTFVPSTLLSTRPPRTRPQTCRLRAPCATLIPPDDDLRVRFNRDEEQPKKSFFPTPEKATSPRSPNERVLDDVRDSMRRLGVSDTPDAPAPRPFRPIDISRVNPLSAYVGSLGAAAISYCAWIALGYIIHFFLTHPFTDELYVIQRIGAVVRTALVCLFALGSGISGVTALGLFLLGVRTTAAAVTGEFADDK